jgi:predicted lipoprotein with Yx(FWY)xxD motif
MTRRTWALTVATLLVITACATDGGGSTTVGDDGGATTSAGGGGSTTTAAGEGSGGGVGTAETELGTILVDPDGFTLYVFTNDAGGESTCNDACASTWPAVPGDTPIGSDLDASLFSTVARTDGTDQLTVNGQPLYRYAPDANPGDTNGQGVGGVWFVVDAGGSMIGAEAAGRYDY